MDTRIDLTERGDFLTLINPFNFILPIDAFENEQMLMTNEEYQDFCRYVDIFGERHHITQRRQIFYDNDMDFDREIEAHCCRCGKNEAPWNLKYGCCRRCNAQENSQLPWKPQNTNHNIKDELFNSR